MCKGDLIIDKDNSLFKGWEFLWIHSNGMLGGLVTTWQSSFTLLNSFYMHLVLCVVFKCKNLNRQVSILYMYGPYDHKQVFWDQLFSLSLFEWYNMIIDRDMNFTLSGFEVWGRSMHVDEIFDYF